MNVLHANAHSALYLDVRSLLPGLGHRVHSWCLSHHLSTIGRRRSIEGVRALGGWEGIDAAYCERFARDYRRHLDGFDAFIVDHPICFAALFEHTGRPVIANATTRYDQGVTFDPARWRWLDDTLRRMFDRGQLIPLSNNRGDEAYLRDRLGFEWPATPTLCDYPAITYSGGREEWLHASLVRAPLPKPYAWQDLGAYRGIVHVPYNCSQMSVTEHYAAALPIVVPSPARLLELALGREAGAMTQVSFLGVSGLPPGEGWNNYHDAGVLRRWIELSDWYDDEWMPHVVRADDPFDQRFLSSLDAHAISANVAAFLPRRRERILRTWTAALATAGSRA